MSAMVHALPREESQSSGTCACRPSAPPRACCRAHELDEAVTLHKWEKKNISYNTDSSVLDTELLGTEGKHQNDWEKQHALKTDKHVSFGLNVLKYLQGIATLWLHHNLPNRH